MWSEGIPRGARFDVGAPSASLVGFLARESAAERSGDGAPAFVPGAGRAYDSVALARHGYKVTALDIAPTAVKEAEKQLAEAAAQPEGLGAGSAVAICGDFFAHSEKYMLAWDATFLCALPPSLRDSWADAHARLALPGARLVALVFPIFEPGSERATSGQGPPFPLTVAVVKELLVPRGFVVEEHIEPLSELEAHKPGGSKKVGGASSALLVLRRAS